VVAFKSPKATATVALEKKQVVIEGSPKIVELGQTPQEVKIVTKNNDEKMTKLMTRYRLTVEKIYRPYYDLG